MERRSCNCCQVWPGGRCSRVSTTSARDWRRVAVSPQNPPVLSRTSGSNPKFCRAQRCCMSVCFRFRSVYLSAAARGVVAEGHNTELWNGDVIAQSKANLGDRPQEDFTTTNSTPLFCMLCGKSILICSAHHFHNDALKTFCDLDFYGPPCWTQNRWWWSVTGFWCQYTGSNCKISPARHFRQIHDCVSAGSLRLRLSGLKSRAHLIRK